jgi:penicillin-binding protein 1A
MVGGSDYDVSKFNLAAQGRRQPGSAFKTFALTAAVERGIDPYTTYYESMPLELDIPGSTEPWRVKTFANSYYGSTNVYQATLRSDNTIFAQLALDVGAENIVDVAHRMGITSRLDPNPAIALGGLTYGVSPLEMASAYATLANEGKHRQSTVILKVTDPNGEVIWRAEPKETQAISSGVAYAVTEILEQNIRSGTGGRARLDRPAAGKTGTAQNYQDAWFCGFIPELSTAVWMGHPEAQIQMRNVHGIRVTGGSFPAIIWAKFMKGVQADYPDRRFKTPEVRVEYDYKFKSRFAVEPTTTTESTTTTGVTIIFPTTGTTPTTAPATTATVTTTTLAPPITVSTDPPPTSATMTPPTG